MRELIDLTRFLFLPLNKATIKYIQNFFNIFTTIATNHFFLYFSYFSLFFSFLSFFYTSNSTIYTRTSILHTKSPKPGHLKRVKFL
ncbi:hypothetical protein Hanom_Chr00s082437g01794651 [Helianthus anomalus]